MCYEYQEASPNSTAGRLQGKCKEGINVLGMVTLSDLDRMQKEGASGRGWIACMLPTYFHFISLFILQFVRYDGRNIS